MSDVVASQVSVRDLKTHLSAWLARAQAGEVTVLFACYDRRLNQAAQLIERQWC